MFSDAAFRLSSESNERGNVLLTVMCEAGLFCSIGP